MHLSSTSTTSIKELIKESIKSFKRNSENSIVTDIYLFPNMQTGLLSIMDDEDQLLAKTEIEEWSNAEDEDELLELISADLKEILSSLKDDKLFDNINILKPYSFVLIDEHGEVIEDLLLMDDDLLIVNDSLLNGLDEELDSFLKHLLED